MREFGYDPDSRRGELAANRDAPTPVGGPCRKTWCKFPESSLGQVKPIPSVAVRSENLAHYLTRYVDEYRRTTNASVGHVGFDT